LRLLHTSLWQPRAPRQTPINLAPATLLRTSLIILSWCKISISFRLSVISLLSVFLPFSLISSYPFWFQVFLCRSASSIYSPKKKVLTGCLNLASLALQGSGNLARHAHQSHSGNSAPHALIILSWCEISSPHSL